MKLVFFDVDGVLVHGYHARPERRICWDQHIERDFGIKQKRFQREFIYGPFVNEVLIGKRDLHHALSEILPYLGYHGDPQVFIDYWLKNDANVNHDLIDRVRILKDSGQVRLFIVTNQEHNRARYLMNELGLSEFFERIFYAAEIGCMKPDIAYFDYIANELDLKKEDPPIFFDDTPDVITAARYYGWDAYEFYDTNSLLESAYLQAILGA